MRKTIAVLLTLVTLSVMGGWSVDPSSGNSTGFSLIEYIENNEVQSPEEFNKIIEVYTDYPSPEYSLDEISYFNVSIDYDNELVCVTTIEMSQSRATETSKKASKDYYNDIGARIFTISVTARFSYYSGSCTTLSKSGSFTKPFYSTWTSTPSVTSGNISTSKAFAKISGTAVSGGNTKTYSLTLTCDDSGNISSY